MANIRITTIIASLLPHHYRNEAIAVLADSVVALVVVVVDRVPAPRPVAWATNMPYKAEPTPWINPEAESNSNWSEEETWCRRSCLLFVKKRSGGGYKNKTIISEEEQEDRFKANYALMDEKSKEKSKETELQEHAITDSEEKELQNPLRTPLLTAA